MRAARIHARENDRLIMARKSEGKRERRVGVWTDNWEGEEGKSGSMLG